MKSIRVVLAAVVTVILALAGCSASPAATESAVASAVIASDPNIDDVFVTTGSGLAGLSIRVRVYVKSTDAPTVARTLDRALRAILVGAPARPAGFDLDVAGSDKPRDVNLAVGSIDLEPAAREAGLYELYSDDSLGGPTDDLEARYGTWDELHR